jgi:glycosyltransferase involved in cell wall biosynthesis
MDYFPNVDACVFFTREVFPRIRQRVPDAHFTIVGSRPTKAVKMLESTAGVTVTGSVPDVRSFLAAARVAVVPLRVSQGIQNKILEALAAGLPVVATPNAAGGLHTLGELPVTVADEPEAFASLVVQHLVSAPRSTSEVAAARVVLAQHYDWSTNLDRLESLFTQPRFSAISVPSAVGSCR